MRVFFSTIRPRGDVKSFCAACFSLEGARPLRSLDAGTTSGVGREPRLPNVARGPEVRRFAESPSQPKRYRWRPIGCGKRGLP